jgi:hypothetical protein
MANEQDMTPSRLLTSTETLRNTVTARNIYTPDAEYPTANQTTVNKTVNAINSVISVLTPFKSYNLENTVYGRIVTNRTPLATIGLTMLGKQMALNAMSSIAQDNFPTIKVANLFDNNPSTKLFTKKVNYSITVKSGTTPFQKFLNSAVYWYVAADNPFVKTPTNDDYIKNTGTAQLDSLYSAVNKNTYKQGKEGSVFYEYADKAGEPIKPRDFIYNATKTFFNFNDDRIYPYLKTRPKEESIARANSDMNYAYTSTGALIQEYAPNAVYVESYFGNTISKTSFENLSQAGLGYSQDYNMNNWIGNDTEFSNDNINNKIVWGRDGVSSQTNKELSQLQGLPDDATVQPQSLKSGFNINVGLLEYTRNLINATEGRVGDITRKAFVKDNKIVGFNGSGVWKAPSTALPEFAGKTGVRQHSVLDQYDKFAKAIRFNGNNVYGGNQDSVIFNSVLPRIHPVLNKEGVLENKNMMFSIENLAVRVISKDGYGIIDDEYGSKIPASEVGPFNGRIMWFPPYNIDFNETATAKYESTVMVGRNEPMYNYMNSERTANLNFTMLIDYPPQLRNFSNSKTLQKDIAEFFAFGGQSDLLENKYSDNLELRIKLLQKQIDDIKGSGIISEPRISAPTPIHVYFPNNVPSTTDDLNSIFDEMYKRYHYEIIPECGSSDGAAYGLNQPVYYVNNLIEHYTEEGNVYYEVGPDPESQYDVGRDVVDEVGTSSIKLNNTLTNVYDNEYLRKYYSIRIVGTASKLYNENGVNGTEAQYNTALGERRANATKNLIEARLKAIYGKSAQELGIEIITSTSGSMNASVNGATASSIPLRNTKLERSADINIFRNSKTFEKVDKKLTSEEQATIDQLLLEIDTLQTQINNASSPSELVMNERKASETAILNGYQSVGGNYLYPAFHSQTPEDFHKRLTFLHQCTRQGAAKRYNVVDENGILRAKNSVFGRQPICILRVGDFYYTKVIIESIAFDFSETTWDMNPEGFGMQPMIAKISMQMKIIGGQSLKGPIDALQNAVSFNYYANSNYTSNGMYKLPSNEADKQEAYINGILTTEKKNLEDAYAANVAKMASKNVTTNQNNDVVNYE